jgi:hypothetical protein
MFPAEVSDVAATPVADKHVHHSLTHTPTQIPIEEKWTEYNTVSIVNA